jgi:hypothetical protein
VLDTAVQELLALSASRQLSTADLESLLLQAIAKATRVRSSLDPEDKSWDREPYKLSLKLLKQRDGIIQLLLAAQSERSLTPCGVYELLHACILHGVVSTAMILLQEPATQHLDVEQLEQLLLTHLTQHTEQYREQEDGKITQLLELLLQHPAAAALDAAALSRLIVGHGAYAAAADSSKDRRRMLGQGMLGSVGKDDGGDEAFDPVELLVGLPAVQQLDVAGVAAVLAAAGEVQVSRKVFEVLCSLPAASGLDTAQLRQLLCVCAQHYNAGAFSRLLQHPAAPGRGDSQVQEYAGMLGC